MKPFVVAHFLPAPSQPEMRLRQILSIGYYLGKNELEVLVQITQFCGQLGTESAGNFTCNTGKHRLLLFERTGKIRKMHDNDKEFRGCLVFWVDGWMVDEG